MAKKKLTDYRAKRDFTRTPEPAGDTAAGLRRDAAAPSRNGGDGKALPTDVSSDAPASAGTARFVVQRHRARRLHYDLRLEIDGVLVSWAVPKGPTLDPKSRRAAFHVEDHPIDYLDFEGVIPTGEYGGGDVIVWDFGTWQPHGTDDPARAVADGELHFDVHGDKLHGRLLLIRRDRDTSGREQWLLLHKRDEHARAGWNPEDHPRSVLTRRTNEQVHAEPARIWQSNRSSAASPPGVETAGAAANTRAATKRGRTGTRTDHQQRAAAKPDTNATRSQHTRRAAAEGGTDRPGPGDEQLAALDDLGAGGNWHVFGRDLRVTHLDKVLFPARRGEPAVTKREFLRYTAVIAPTVLPYLAGRALNMHRYPNGADAKGFWHKQLPGHAPAWLPRWHNDEAGPGETTTYLVADEPAALVWAANFGALEWHAWTSRTEAPHQPSYALVDIDPGTDTAWDDVLALARLHRTALDHLGVRGVPKVTGRRGIQIWIPVQSGTSFDECRIWVEQLSHAVGGVVPELVSWRWEVRDRGGRARLDYTQNAINKTLVAPYSPRAATGAPVSAPIAWDDLDDPSLRPDVCTIRTIPDRLADRGDLFRPVLEVGQELPPIR